jgi:hypothetical protein
MMALVNSTSQTLHAPSGSRRALLLGALGGCVTLAAGMLGRSSPVEAADGDALRVGVSNSGTTPTKLLNDANGNQVLWAESGGDGIGVYGISQSSIGLKGESTSNNGVYGHSQADDQAAIVGQSKGDGTGVLGYSGKDSVYLQDAPQKTGVFGEAPSGVGVYGRASNGRGGQFSGGKAQVRLMPSSAATHPANGALGDLFLDKSGRLWFCKGGKTWKQIA